jgi:hypothetical protein
MVTRVPLWEHTIKPNRKKYNKHVIPEAYAMMCSFSSSVVGLYYYNHNVSCSGKENNKVSL